MRKFLLTIFIFLYLIPLLPVQASIRVTNYLSEGDHIVISPAEDWEKGKRKTIINDNGWRLTVQNNNTANGNDIQMWQFGISDKFEVTKYGHMGEGTFCLRPTNFSESSESPRYVDVEWQSNEEGTNIHVWNKCGNEHKFFYLENSCDKDPEIFYIVNYFSGKYLAPRDYFDRKDKTCMEKGKNTVLSSRPYKWRVSVIDREVPGVASDWMKNIPDNTYLSELNIPGSHDAGTANVDGSSCEGYNIAACQKYFIDEQLIAGIRAFDIRLAWDNDLDTIVLSHGPLICRNKAYGKLKRSKMMLSKVIEELIDYLRKHNSETVITLFKIEYGDKDKISREFKYILEGFKEHFYNWSSTSPTLNQVRGKIVSFSRIKGINGEFYGPDLSKWDKRYNRSVKIAQRITECKVLPKVYIQDYYESSNKDKKKYFYETLRNLNGENGKKPSKYSFIFNYTSCQQFAINTPLNAARSLNKYILSPLSNVSMYIDKKKRLGIVMMDYVDKSISKRIYGAN